MARPKQGRRPAGTGRVYEFPAGSGTWWAQLPERNGKSGPKWRVPDRKTGEELLAQRLQELKEGIRVYDQSITMLEWMHHCIVDILALDNKATTIKNYRQITRLYIEPYTLAKTKLGDLGLPSLRTWAVEISAAVSAVTGRRYATLRWRGGSATVTPDLARARKS